MSWQWIICEKERAALFREMGHHWLMLKVISWVIQSFTAKLSRKRTKMKPAPIKELITFEDFEKLDIRVGTITAVAEVEKSRKLMKLTVDFGDHVRSILAGIKQERENPFEIEGKQALFVVNLPEQKMAGEVSQGMLFDIGYADKLTPCLAIPEATIPNGSRAG
ncbi:hypothetical protein H744_2c1414 [Photobacterium gaetbulicola Gung47]|uniref:tRNA-binding domain-containing protein n=2 Tax=Photobacterium gaetbulicola TaxID=1295392 RepID=A0A0C5WNZ1_9GAMM|nr:hypothetical protein H744_2c1414 [Photobacterium gaetbulicola Gung47]